MPLPSAKEKVFAMIETMADAGIQPTPYTVSKRAGVSTTTAYKYCSEYGCDYYNINENAAVPTSEECDEHANATIEARIHRREAIVIDLAQQLGESFAVLRLLRRKSQTKWVSPQSISFHARKVARIRLALLAAMGVDS